MVRVATFNIRNGRALDGRRSWPFRRRATARAIRALDADIIGLQEVHPFQLRWLQRQVPDYVVAAGAGRGGGGRGERCPLLVRRTAATLLEVTTRWYGDAPGGRLPGASFPRIATIAHVRLTASDLTVQVLNTHLDESHERNRERSAAQVLDWLDRSVPHLVLGDLNAEPGDPSLGLLLEELRPVLGPEDGGTAHGFTGRRDGRQIDHILVSGDWTIGAATIAAGDAGPLPSDHWPVVADLEVRPPDQAAGTSTSAV